MPRSTRREQVWASLYPNFEAGLERHRSVFITSLLLLWAFRLTLDPMQPLDDMAFMNGLRRPCSIEFKTRVPETELRRIMEKNSEAA
jgi:hypothetical protein